MKVAAVCQVTTTCIATRQGYSNRWDSVSDNARSIAEKVRFLKLARSLVLTQYLWQAYYAGQIFYVGSVGLTRVSLSLFLLRLTRGWRKDVALALTWICAVLTVAGIFIIALRPDLSHPWSTLDGSYSMVRRRFLFIARC